MDGQTQSLAELSETELDKVSGSYTLIELLPPPRVRRGHGEQIEINSWSLPPANG